MNSVFPAGPGPAPGVQHVPGLACPSCGRHSPHLSHPDNAARPVTGDAAVCWKCGALAVFEVCALGSLSLREPTEAERAEMATEPEVRQALALMAGAVDPLHALDRRRRAAEGES